MKQKVMLIVPYNNTNEPVCSPPLGLAYMASYLRSKATVNSYDIRIVDANVSKISNEKLIEIIKNFNPDIVGIQMNVLDKSGTVLSKLIKSKFPDILICIGGCVVSSNPVEVLKMSNSDIAIIGEGEITFFEICEGKKLSEIDGIVCKDKEFRFNKPRKLIENLDDIPHPAFDLLPDFRLYSIRARKTPVMYVMTSRGCPFQCTYCNSNIFGNRFRSHSPEYVLEEIDLLLEKFGVKEIDIMDDNFTLDKDRAEKILDLIIQKKFNIVISLGNGVRADCMTENLVKKMKKAGVFKVSIGVESANKEVLASIKKRLDLNKVVEVTKWFRKYNIITFGLFMVGFPNDTRESINETIDFAIRLNPTQAIFSMLIPFPGSEIYAYLKEHNLLIYPDKIFYDSGFRGSKQYLKGNLSYDELLSLHKKAYFKFNFRISKIWDIVKNIRSFNEFLWFVKATVFVFKNMVLKMDSGAPSTKNQSTVS